MSQKLFGVAAIIDERTIIINYGKEDGAKVGMEVNVLSNHNETIRDPFTKEEIGKIYHIKAELTINRVEEKLSYCTSKKQLETNKFNIGLGSSHFHNNKVLRVDSDVLTREITDEPIKVSDEVEILNLDS